MERVVIEWSEDNLDKTVGGLIVRLTTKPAFTGWEELQNCNKVISDCNFFDADQLKRMEVCASCKAPFKLASERHVTPWCGKVKELRARQSS